MKNLQVNFYLIVFILVIAFKIKAQPTESIQVYKDLLETGQVDFSKRKISKTRQGFFKVQDFFENGKVAFIGETKTIFPNDSEATEGKTHFYPNGNVRKVKRIDGKEIVIQEFYSSEGLYKEYSYQLGDTEFRVMTVKSPSGQTLVANGNGISVELGQINETHFLESGLYENGFKKGEWKANKEDGKLLFVENYDKKGLIEGISYNEDGTTNVYKGESEIPFKGGQRGLQSFLTKTIELPREAMKNNISGRVSTRFKITKEGEIKDIECLNDAPDVLKKEAFRVIEKSKGKWIPIKKKGFAVEEYFMLPIVFTVAGI